MTINYTYYSIVEAMTKTYLNGSPFKKVCKLFFNACKMTTLINLLKVCTVSGSFDRCCLLFHDTRSYIT